MNNKRGEQKLSVSKILNSKNREAVLPALDKEYPVQRNNSRVEKDTRKKKSDEDYYEPGAGETEINLKEYLEILFRYKWLILAVFIAVLLATLAYSYAQEPVYKSNTKIFIHEDVMELQVINNKPYFKQAYDLNTWIQIMKSSEITKRVSEKLSHRVSAASISKMMDYDTERDEEHIISATCTSKEPKMSAEIANAVYHALSEYDASQRLKGYDYSVKYLEQLLADKRKELNELDAFINDFMKKKGIDANTINITDNLDRVSELQNQIDGCKVDLAAISASIKKINYDLNREDQSIVNQTTYSETYKIRLMNLEADKARALSSYTEKHPKILAIQQNIDNVKQLIEDGMGERIQLQNIGANPIKQRLINDLLSNETSKVALEQKIAALRKILSEIEISADFKNLLEDKFNLKNDLLVQISNLQNQYNNAKLNSNVSSSRLYQLQEAEVPTNPSANNMKRNLMIGIVLGFGLGFGLALLLNSMNDTIRSVSDYESKYSIPIIGIIPKFTVDPLSVITEDLCNEQDLLDQKTEKPEKIELVDNDEEETEEHKKTTEELLKLESIFEPIIINFKYLMLHKDQKAFAIQSTLHKEGKTFLSYYLAKHLAKENLNVLIMDTDFYKRTLSRELNCKEHVGLSEVLSEQTELNNAIIRNKEHKFWFMPAGKKPPNISAMYKSANFSLIMDKLKGIYDIVILDTPAFLLVPSITYFLSVVDGTLLPVRINYTTHSNLNRIISKSELYNINIMGSFMNYAQYLDRKYYKYEYDYNYYYDKENRTVKNSVSQLVKKANIFKAFSSKNKRNQIIEKDQNRNDRVNKPEKSFINKIRSLIFFEEEE